MGEFVFVPGKDFNQSGEAPSGKFSINLDQLCDPYYKLMLGVDGALVDYTYRVYARNPGGDNPVICTGSFTNTGIQEHICAGAPFVPGQTYYIDVFYASNTTIKETQSFEVIACNTALALEYCCNAGLRLINAPQTSGTVTISKGTQTETVAYPFVTEVYLEDGEYNIDFAGVATAKLIVECNLLIKFGYSCYSNGHPVLYSFYSEEVYDVPGDGIFVSSSQNCDLGYPDIVSTINIYDNLNVLVHSHTHIVGPSSLAQPDIEIGYFNISNARPLNNTQYRVEILSSLSSLTYLGVFNNFIVDTGYVFTTYDCGTTGWNDYIKVTNIRCDPKGILVDIEILQAKTITDIWFYLDTDTGRSFYKSKNQYGDINPKRTILIPSSAFGGCLSNWILVLEWIATRDFSNNVINYFYYKLYIPELFKGLNCLKCNWKEVCFEGQST